LKKVEVQQNIFTKFLFKYHVKKNVSKISYTNKTNIFGQQIINPDNVIIYVTLY